MKEEFNLSSKIDNRPIKSSAAFVERELVIPVKDFKEFIEIFESEVQKRKEARFIRNCQNFKTDEINIQLTNFKDEILGVLYKLVGDHLKC